MTSSDESNPVWEVGIRAWGPSDAPGEYRWEHYHPRAPDKQTAKEKAIEMATSMTGIVGMMDSYEVYQVEGPYTSVSDT